MAGKHGRAVGIDFGTSTSLIAERAGRRPVEVAPLGRATRWFPSVAGLVDGSVIVGENADDLPPSQAIRSIKRAITERRETVTVDTGGGVHDIRADTVILAVLHEMATRAKNCDLPLGYESDIRLGCPAMWDGEQRERLRGLAELAGLPSAALTLVDEPIAAGVSWVTHRFLAYGERPEGRLLVFDMGGGTLDIAVLDVVGGERPEISVLSALGAALAGDTLDEAIARDLNGQLESQGHLLGHRPASADPHLLRAARDAKIRLSQSWEHRIVLPRALGRLPVLSYTREQLQEAFRPQLDEAERLVLAALRAARLTEQGSRSPSELMRLGLEDLRPDVSYVLLVGGMSRIPYVLERLGAMFPSAQVFDNAGVDPDEAIVAGLADTAGYDRLNLHRPGFDFVLQWVEGGQAQEAALYEAYTPFYAPYEVLSGKFDLSYERRGRDFPGPRNGPAVIRVRATTGEHLALKVDGRAMDGMSIELGTREMLFKLSCNGRIVIWDGRGKRTTLRVDKWPVVWGRDQAHLVLRQAEGPAPAPPTPWYLEKEWAPPAQRAAPRPR